METDWSICFICQVKNTDKVRSTDDGYINLADRLPKFKGLGEQSYCIYHVSMMAQEYLILYVKTMLFTIGIATRCTMLSIYFVVKISRKSVIQLP